MVVVGLAVRWVLVVVELLLITVACSPIRGLRMVVVGLVRVVVRWAMIAVLLWLITVGWTPVHGLRVVAVGSVRVVVWWAIIDVLKCGRNVNVVVRRKTYCFHCVVES